MDTMRAGRLVELGKMVCEQAPVSLPGDGELLVRTAYASICGSDLHMIYLGIPYGGAPKPPGFPGHEGIGAVVQSRHPDFAEGDLVLTMPFPPESFCFAELQRVHGRFCLKLPRVDVPPLELMMAQQLGTVIFALRKRPIDVVGKTVLVMGQGSAGMFFAYLVKRAGAAKVIASDLSEARLAQGRNMGVDVALQAEHDNVREAVLDHTGGAGVDFLIEAVGRKETLLQTVDLVKASGDMLLFGLPDTMQPVPFNFHDFFRKAVTAHSAHGAQFEADLVSFRTALDLIVRRQIDVAPLVSHVLPVEQVGEAIEMANDRSNNALKVSLSF